MRSSWFTARGLTGGYLRRHALDNGHLIDPVFGDFEPDRVAASLRIAAPVAFKKAWRGDPDAAKKVMRTKLAGTVSRIVLNGARDTIHRTTRESRVIVGWRRVTDADPCFFCAMLAGRGAVYKSGRTAGDPRWGGEPYHDHCQCTALPLYEHEDEPPEVDDLYEQWQAATAGRSGSAAIRAWRRHWESRRR